MATLLFRQIPARCEIVPQSATFLNLIPGPKWQYPFDYSHTVPQYIQERLSDDISAEKVRNVGNKHIFRIGGEISKLFPSLYK